LPQQSLFARFDAKDLIYEGIATFWRI